MPTQPTPLRPPDPRVDIGALAGDIQLDAAERIANTITHAAHSLDDKGRALDEMQQAGLVCSALRHFDGFEVAVAARLRRALGQAGVETWGLPDELARLLGEKTL